MIGDKNKNLKQFKVLLASRAGFSLPEMVLAIGLFSVLVVIAGNVLVSARQGQQFAVASQNVQENMHFIFETMSKEMRSAIADGATAPCSTQGFADPLKVFNTENAAASVGGTAYFDSTGTILEFKNRLGQCVKYSVVGGKLNIGRDLSNPFDDGIGVETYVVTPTNSVSNPNAGITVNSLNFYVVDDEVGAFHSVQPRVTMSIEVQSNNPKFPQTTLLQTTISSRRYE